jgi:hypothetical protein
MENSNKLITWQEEASRNPDYYLDTDKGRKELSEMIKKETESLLKELKKNRQRIKEIIWFSNYCPQCSNYIEKRKLMKCEKFNVKIIKPFFGKPIWSISLNSKGEEESRITGIDWNSKAFPVSDSIIEEASLRINKGLPYSCFHPQQ